MRPHVSGTERVVFSKARRSWESGSSITTVDFSLFRLLRKASAVNVRWTEHDSYLSFSQKNSSWHFLALAKLRSMAQVWNHKRNFQLVNKGWLSLVRWQLSCSRFAQAIVRTLLATDNGAFLKTQRHKYLCPDNINLCLFNLKITLFYVFRT